MVNSTIDASPAAASLAWGRAIGGQTSGGGGRGRGGGGRVDEEKPQTPRTQRWSPTETTILLVSRHYAWDQIKLVSQVQPGAAAAAAAAASMRRAPTVPVPVPVASTAYERPLILILRLPVHPVLQRPKEAQT